MTAFNPTGYCCASVAQPTKLAHGAIANLSGACGETRNLNVVRLLFSDGSKTEAAYCTRHYSDAVARTKPDYVTDWSITPTS